MSWKCCGLFLTALSGLLLGCSGTNTTTAPPVTSACTFRVTLSAMGFPCTGGCSVGFNSGGSERTANVVTESTCRWTVGSNVGWLTATPAVGTGTGTVRYSAAANPDSRRVGDLTLAGTHIDVHQSGGRPCSYTFTPLNVSVPAAGGSATVDQAPSSNGCSSTVATNVSWITIPEPNAQGSVLIRFSTASNPDTTPRSGLLIVTPCTGTDESDCESTGLLPPVSVMVTQAGSS